MAFYVSKITGKIILGFKHRGPNTITRLSEGGISSYTSGDIDKTIVIAGSYILTKGQFFTMDIKTRKISIISRNILKRFFIKLNK